MEIPVINRISDFQAGISSLQNPSFLSQLFAISGIENLNQASSFWKWGALILALLASFTTVINRIKILIIRLRLRHVNGSLPSHPLLDDDEDYDSETDASCSSSSDDEEEEDQETEEEEASVWTSSNWRKVGEDFHTRGSGHYVDDKWQSCNLGLGRRGGSFGDLFSWSEIAAGGKSVVKLWDNLGLGFRLDLGESSTESVLSFHETSEGRDVGSFFRGKFGIIPSSSPAVVLAAGESQSGSVAFSAWDTRVRGRIPAILAEWTPKLGRIVGVCGGGLEKVYVRDDFSDGLMVGDMRKINSPLTELTESDVKTWWDADAVMVTNESVDGSM